MTFPLRTSALLAALLLLVAAPAAAQSSPETAPAETTSAQAAEECETDLSGPIFSGGDGDAAAAPAPAALTRAEERVREILSEDGVHVVRLWAPWCPNSTGEMEEGWDTLIEENDDVSFTFVTVWNNGNGGSATLREYGLPLGERLTEVVPADPEQGRLSTFLGYAVNWVPSTWIFRTTDEGETIERAFALNYGEMDRATLQTLVDAARRDW